MEAVFSVEGWGGLCEVSVVEYLTNFFRLLGISTQPLLIGKSN